MKTIKVSELKNGQYIQIKSGRKWTDGLFAKSHVFSWGTELYIDLMASEKLYRQSLGQSLGYTPGIWSINLYFKLEEVRVPIIKRSKVTYFKVVEDGN